LALILAGYDADLNPQNADAQIGAVKVGGDWVASSLAAGATDGGDGFGNATDAVIAGGNDSPAIQSRIASIQIGGQALGTPDAVNNTDHFGFVAQQIGSFKVGGTVFPLLALANDDLAVGATGDLRLREV